jgi:protein-L-isoaspartate(D-aspartate) O-methyltransferase
MRRDKVRMLNEQLLDRGITDPAVLRAIANVPRERFVLAETIDEAYADRALPIECGQSISQPYMVGLMTQTLALSGQETVLEIGTGSGYQTAILAQLAGHVFTIERHVDLSQSAKYLLAELGYRNVTFLAGDGTRGWPLAAPYDRILVAAAAPTCPDALIEQLAENGILVIPLGGGEDQVLEQIRKHAGHLEKHELIHCRFVPLIAD